MKRTYLLCLIFLSFFKLVYSQTPVKPRDASINGPQTFAIVLGISKYKYVKPLAFADKDAMLFRDYLKSPGGGTVKDENIFLLLNEKASNANFWGKGFQWLKAKNLRKGDRLFIYLAGHGDAIDEDQFFFLGYDCNPAGDKNNYLVAGTIQLFNLKKKIAAETTKGVEVFFIMDACRSNELPGGRVGQNFLNSAVSEKKAGEMIMLATGAGQESLEDASIGNGQGLFTYYLVDGLTGLADLPGPSDYKITFQEIQRYVNSNVPAIALQRFKRKQDPYFCCTEYASKTISIVDTAYLKRWIQTKKQERRGPGNSFSGPEKIFNLRYNGLADTVLIETYNAFNSALSNNHITGSGSASELFRQLETKYPENPYTLDARSSLAVEYINLAQARIDRYLICGEKTGRAEQEKNESMATLLEQAIDYVRNDDEDFANSLLPRLYFLRAGGIGNAASVYSNAHASLAVDREGAYIQNRLALLHYENKQQDSAIYYAQMAVSAAPNWPCAQTTLSLVRQLPEQPKKKSPTSSKSIVPGGLGIFAGGGIGRFSPTYIDAPNSNVIGVNGKDKARMELGISYQFPIGNRLSLRPQTTILFEGSDLIYDSRPVTGGQITRDTVSLRQSSFAIALPFQIYFGVGKIQFYLSAGPSFTYLDRESGTRQTIPVKKAMFMGDIAVGIDILVHPKFSIMPELKFTQGLNNVREEGSNQFTDNLSALRKRGIQLGLYIKKRK